MCLTQGKDKATGVKKKKQKKINSNNIKAN